jgi:hypothetical protein
MSRKPHVKSHKRIGQVVIVSMWATVLLVIAVPAANAASFKYASNVSTPEYQARYSGQRSSVTGGKVSVALGVAATQTIITYYPAPGYSEVGHASGAAPHDVYLWHQRARNSRSKCYWSWNSVGGSADLNCWAYS